MPLITGSNILETVFTPAVGTFIVQATGGVAALERRQVSGAAWARIQPIIDSNSKNGNAFNVENPVAGVEYRFMAIGGTTPIVRADQ